MLKVDMDTALKWHVIAHKWGLAFHTGFGSVLEPNEYFDIYSTWATVFRGSARVNAGADEYTEGQNTGPFDLPPGLYFWITFRVTHANSALADTLEDVLVNENAQRIGRIIGRLGGKSRLLA